MTTPADPYLRADAPELMAVFGSPTMTADIHAAQEYFRGSMRQLAADMLAMLPPGRAADRAVSLVTDASVWACEALRLANWRDEEAPAPESGR